MLQTGDTAGRWEGAVFDGCVMTSNIVWAFERSENGTLVAGIAVLRKPGMYVVVEQTSGTCRLTITDGVPSAGRLLPLPM